MKMETTDDNVVCVFDCMCCFVLCEATCGRSIHLDNMQVLVVVFHERASKCVRFCVVPNARCCRCTVVSPQTPHGLFGPC